MITKVAKIHKGKVFDYHEEDDIEQQVWIIAIEALPKYRQDRTKTKNALLAFESWLNSVVSKRLKNFYRDNYSVKNKEKPNDSQFDKDIKNNLSRPLELSVAETTVGVKNIFLEVPIEEVEDMLMKLPEDLRQVFLLQKSGINITGYYSTRLKEKMRELHEA